MDLTGTIAGVKFPACFMNASGALCVTHEELSALGRSRSGAIVTKSMTVEARQGIPAAVLRPPAVRSIPWGC
jgi:dihydroorotate dehydrogenase (fumarate)